MTQSTTIAMVHDYPPSEGGGIEVNVSRLVCFLRKLGFNAVIFTSRRVSHSLPDPATKYAARYVNIVAPSRDNARSIILNYEIIHIHLTFSLRPLSMCVLEMCQALNRRLIVSFHTTPSHTEFSRIATVAERNALVAEMIDCLNNSKAVVLAHSAFNITALRDLGVRRPIVRTWAGIDPVFFDVNLRQSQEYDCASIGELSTLKGTDDLVRLVENLQQDFAIFPRVLLLGDGPLRAWVESQARMKKLHIDVRGYVEHSQVPALVQKTPVIIHLSRSEDYPLSLLESLAMRRIVVARNVGGVGELLENGAVGFLVDDVQEATTVAARLIAGRLDTSWLKRNLDAWVRRCRDKHTYAAQTRLFLAVYRSILQGWRGSRHHQSGH